MPLASGIRAVVETRGGIVVVAGNRDFRASGCGHQSEKPEIGWVLSQKRRDVVDPSVKSAVDDAL